MWYDTFVNITWQTDTKLLYSRRWPKHSGCNFLALIRMVRSSEPFFYVVVFPFIPCYIRGSAMEINVFYNLKCILWKSYFCYAAVISYTYFSTSFSNNAKAGRWSEQKFELLSYSLLHLGHILIRIRYSPSQSISTPHLWQTTGLGSLLWNTINVPQSGLPQR